MVRILSAFVVVFGVLCAMPAMAQEEEEGIGAESGPLAFPVRDPDSDSPLHAVWQLLKMAIEGGDEAKAFQDYLQWIPKDRTATKEKVAELKAKEFKNLLTNASGYLSQDQFGLKLMVISMNPKPDKIDKSTKKVYVALKNTIEPDDRSGLFILERGPKGWVVRSLNL